MYSQDEILKYIRGIPKTELHLHIEGSFEPDLVFEIAKRNSLTVKIEGNSNQETLTFDTPAQLAKAYSFDNLQEFLDIYYAGMNVLQSEQDFYDLTMAYLIKCNDQNIVHTEIFFDPQGHTSRGIPFATVINGIYSALQEGEKKFGISSGLILSYLRHLSEEEAINTWQEAQPHLDKFIAVGLDSSELGHPPSKFKHVFSMARDANKKLVAHAGEEGPPEYIWQALDILKVDRIDHGNRSLEDPKLVERLVKEKIALTVCPLSNDKLQVVKNMKDHPLKKMLDLGLVATVHSDDPAYFGGYMNENFSAIQAALSLSINDINTLVHHSIDGSFMSENRKIKLHTDINHYHKEFIQSRT